MTAALFSGMSKPTFQECEAQAAERTQYWANRAREDGDEPSDLDAVCAWQETAEDMVQKLILDRINHASTSEELKAIVKGILAL